MFGKKKLNGRIRRRIRKTTAAMLLITSIVVAAIPVPGASAEEPVSGGDATGGATVTDNDYEPAPKTTMTNSVSAGDGVIPLIDDKETIYTYYYPSTGKGATRSTLRFAYCNVPGESGRKAVLLGQAVNETADFTIPKNLKAYVRYDKYDVAANESGQPLFYKTITPMVYERRYDPNAVGAVSGAPSGTETSGWSSLSLTTEGGETTVYKSGDKYPDVEVESPTPVIEKDKLSYYVQKVKLYTYQYVPCRQDLEDEWNIQDAKNEPLRYLSTKSISNGVADVTMFRCLPAGNYLTEAMGRGTIENALKSYEDENSSEGNQSFQIARGAKEDWLDYAEVVCISNQALVQDAGAAAKAGGSRGEQSFFSKKISKLQLPNSMKYIANYSFCQTDLESITFEKEKDKDGKDITPSMSKIGSYAFARCNKMTALPLADMQLEMISDHMFDGCEGLVSVTVPNSITAVADAAFQGCKNLKEIDFSGTGHIKKFGNNIFRDCVALAKASLPTVLEEIGWYNFVGCTGLAEVVVDGNALRNVHFNNFKGCVGLKFIKVLGKEVTFDTSKGGYDVGKFREEMTRVAPQFYFSAYDSSKVHDMTKENSFAFQYLDDPDLYEKVEQVTDSSGKATEIVYTVDQKTGEVKINPKGSPEKLEIASYVGKYPVKTLVEKFIDKESGKNLKSVTIPEGVSKIEAGAFSECNKLEEVHFTSTNQELVIEDQAFTGQSGLVFYGEIEDFTVSAGGSQDKKKVGPYQYAMNPNNNTISGNNKSNSYIDFVDFYASDQSSPSYIHVKLRYDEENPKESKREVTKVPTTQDPEYLKLAEAAWKKTPSGNDVSIEDVIKDFEDYIDRRLDWENRKTVSADMPEPNDDPLADYKEVRDIVKSAFEITLPAGVQTVGADVFSTAIVQKARSAVGGKTTAAQSINKQDVRTIRMEGVEQIEAQAFAGCANLREVSMYPSEGGGETIGAYAFQNCPNLEVVGLPFTVGEIGNMPFKANSKMGTRTRSAQIAGSAVGKDISVPAITFLQKLSRALTGDDAHASSDNQFEYLDGILFENTSAGREVIECLETRGSAIGGSSVEPGELAGVTSVRAEAFMNCKDLTSVDMSSTSIDKLPSDCFNGAAALTTLKLPDNNITIDTAALKNIGFSYGKRVDLWLYDETGTTFFTDTAGYKNLTIHGFDSYIDSKGAKKPTNIYNFVRLAEQQKNGWDWVTITSNDVFTVKLYDCAAKNETGKVNINSKGEKEKGSDLGTLGYGPYKITVQDPDNPDKTSPVDRDFEKVQITLNQIHQKDGYSFIGWDKDWADYRFTKKGGTVELIARYEPSKHTVTFKDDAGKVLAALSKEGVPYGDKLQFPAVPKKGDYTIKGWMDDDPKGSKIWNPDKDTYIVNRSVTFTASYGDKTTASSGSTTTTTTTGSSSSGTSGSGSSSASDNNAAQYTLTVVNGSGSGTYAAGASVTIAANTPNTGYEFDSWTSSEKDTQFTSKTLAATAVTMPAKNLTVTANYKVLNSASGNGIDSKRGTVTSDPASNTGATIAGTNAAGGGANGGAGVGADGGNGATDVQMNRPGMSDGGVASATVNGSTDNFIVKVTEDPQATAAVAEALRNEYGSLENIHYFAMDISLYDSTGTYKITDTSGISVTMTLPIPDELRQYAGNNKVGAVIGGNNLEKLDARFTTVNDVPCVSFTATHFSPYTIYVNTANLLSGGYDATPKTGDAIHPKWFLAAGLALFSAVLFLKKDKKAYRVA